MNVSLIITMCLRAYQGELGRVLSSCVCVNVISELSTKKTLSMLFSKLMKAGAAASLMLTCAGVNAQSWSSNSTYGLYVNPQTGIKGNVAIGVAAGSNYQNNRLTIKAESSKNGLRIYDSAGNTKLLQGSNGGLTVGAATTAPANGLYVYGATKLNGTLNVTGATTLSTTTTGALTTGSLTTNYGATLKSSLSVAGASTFNGTATFNKNFVGKGTSNEFYNGLTINTGTTIYNSIRLKVESGWAQIAAYGYTNYDPMALRIQQLNYTLLVRSYVQERLRLQI